MGIGGLRADFLSWNDKRKCGRKDCEMHVSQPMNIGVCYGLVVFRLFIMILVDIYKHS
jgi:hypothetical protein